MPALRAITPTRLPSSGSQPNGGLPLIARCRLPVSGRIGNSTWFCVTQKSWTMLAERRLEAVEPRDLAGLVDHAIGHAGRQRHRADAVAEEHHLARFGIHLGMGGEAVRRARIAGRSRAAPMSQDRLRRADAPLPAPAACRRATPRWCWRRRCPCPARRDRSSSDCRTCRTAICRPHARARISACGCSGCDRKPCRPPRRTHAACRRRRTSDGSDRAAEIAGWDRCDRTRRAGPAGISPRTFRS